MPPASGAARGRHGEGARGIQALLILLLLKHFPSSETFPKFFVLFCVFFQDWVCLGITELQKHFLHQTKDCPIGLFFVIIWFGVFKNDHVFFLPGISQILEEIL